MPYFIGLILLGATYFLLGGEATDTPSRSLKELWNLSHIAYFFLLLYLIGNLPLLKNIPAKILIPGLVLFSLLVGGLIELSQYATDRTPDSQDIVRNLIGALLALVFLPVLISNDTPFEIDRWRGNADVEIDRIEPANLLKIRLSPMEQYPGTSLRFFPGDWSGYNQLVIRFYNPSPMPLNITVRVHDRAHQTSYHYQDRFRLNTRVQPGWSNLEIGLNQIENGPREREMNMRKISDLSVFTGRLAAQRILYIDKIYLSE
jgi:hypothetical protein